MRTAGRIALAAGAAGSVAFTLYAGRHNSSRLLAALFAIWVLSPFAGLAATDVISKRWSRKARAALLVLMLLIAAVSLAIYGAAALGPPRTKPAFFFVLIPQVSWAAIAVSVVIGASRARGEPRAIRSPHKDFD